tara:strand:+ start:2896 stop:4080 length:1185 start_codon:yes stop_codon:yes gene_type:complete
MATMSLGAVFLMVALVITVGGPVRLFVRFRQEWNRGPARTYLFVSFFFLFALSLSLIVARIWPIQIGTTTVNVLFPNDWAKSWYFIFPLMVAVAIRSLSPRSRNKVLKIWLGSAGVLSAIGLFQFFTGWPRPQMIPSFRPYYHATLFLGHHLSLASIFIFPFFASFDFATRKKGESPLGWNKTRWVILSIVLLICLFLSFSRMLWISLPIGILAFLLFRLHGKFRIGLIAVAILGIVGTASLPTVQKRMKDSLGVQERFDLWEANLFFFKQRPLTGAGFKKNHDLSGSYLFQKYPEKENVFSGHAHNNLLDFLGSMGIMGVIAFVFWSALAFQMAWNSRKIPESFGLGLFVAWGVFHLNGLTQVNFWEAKVMHQMMWMIGWSIVWMGTLKDQES